METPIRKLISVSVSAFCAGLIGCSSNSGGEISVRNVGAVELTSASEIQANLGRKVLVDGIAFNAKLGAVVEFAGDVLYLDNIKEWPAGIADRQVRVIGILDLFKANIGRLDEQGGWSTGVGEGSIYRLVSAQWTVVQRGVGNHPSSSA